MGIKGAEGLTIGISMADITRVFTEYKRLNEKGPTLESKLFFPLDMSPFNFDDIIEHYSLPLYDTSIYNRAFRKMISKGKKHNASFLYDASLFNRYRRTMMTHLGGIPDNTLQIGPGGSLGCEVLMCMSDVRHAYTLDRFPLLSFNIDEFMQTFKAFYDVAAWFDGVGSMAAPCRMIPECEDIGGGCFRIGDSIIQHYRRSFEDTCFEDESIDFLFSQATFEHVREPIRCIGEIGRVLKQNGITAHCIDLRDHRNFDDPLGFLQVSDAKWATLMDEYCRVDGSLYMNRWRAPDFRQAFQDAGFEILEFQAEMRVVDEKFNSVYPMVDKRFAIFPKEDLNIETLFIVARKR